MLGEGILAFSRQRRNPFARGGNTLLSRVIAVRVRFINTSAPADLIYVPANINSVSTIVIVWLENETIASLADEVQQIDLFSEVITTAGPHLTRPGNVANDHLPLFVAEER